MRIDEVTLVSLNDVLKSSQYLRLLKHLKYHAKTNISASRIKNKIIKSWKKGMKSRKHFDSLLQQINLNTKDLID